MAAVVTPIHPPSRPVGQPFGLASGSTRHLEQAPSHLPGSAGRPGRRPSLVVLEGGRSATRLQRRATYRRRRISALLALAVVVLAMSQLVPAVFGAVTTPPTTTSSTPSGVEISGTTYVARAGDTLWEVATALSAGGDVRDVVDRLAEVNGSASLVVGQELRIPDELLAS